MQIGPVSYRAAAVARPFVGAAFRRVVQLPDRRDGVRPVGAALFGNSSTAIMRMISGH